MFYVRGMLTDINTNETTMGVAALFSNLADAQAHKARLVAAGVDSVVISTKDDQGQWVDQ